MPPRNKYYLLSFKYVFLNFMSSYDLKLQSPEIDINLSQHNSNWEGVSLPSLKKIFSVGGAANHKFVIMFYNIKTKK